MTTDEKDQAQPVAVPEEADRSKRNRNIIIGAVATATIVALLLLGYLSLRSKQSQDLFASGAAHHRAAAKALVGAGKVIGEARAADKMTPKLRREIESVKKGLPKAGREARKAVADFVSLRESALAGNQQLAAVEARRAAEQAFLAIEGAEDTLSILEDVGEAAAAARQAAREFDQAFEKANAGVLLANDSKYAEARDSATAAVTLFEQASARLEKIKFAKAKRDMSSFLARLKKGREWADSIAKQAEAGAADDIPAYNRRVEETNALSKEVSKDEDGLHREQNKVWIQRYCGRLLSSLDMHTKSADKLWRKAIDLWTGKS